MIFLKTDDEIELLRQSNLLVGRTLAEVAKLIKPGVTTKELDKVAEEFIRDNGAVPTFKGFPKQYGDPFPSTLCTSVNDQVVHGIPNDIPFSTECRIIFFHNWVPADLHAYLFQYHDLRILLPHHRN